MTTNYIERLDAALIRPGRVDYIAKLDLATKDQIRKLFLRFFPLNETEAIDFTSKIPANTFSMAQLQGYFLFYKENLQLVMQSTDSLTR